MRRDTFEAILKIKKSELDTQALAFAEMKRQMSALVAKRAGIENELQESAPVEFCAMKAQVSVRWQHAQSRQLDRIDQALIQMKKELTTAEQELRIALGERRAVEKIITKIQIKNTVQS